MIPLYGFLEGDTIGLLVLADEEAPVEALAIQLQQSSRVRVPPRSDARVVVNGRVIAGTTSARAAGLAALDRFDVVWSRPPGAGE